MPDTVPKKYESEIGVTLGFSIIINTVIKRIKKFL